MISNLRIVESWDSIPTHVQPGESIELEWEIHNDASRLDEVEFNWTLDGAQTWAVSLSGPSSASIAPGASTVMRVSMLAPSDGHAGDPAPLITPTITSTRSSITFSGESVTGPRIAQIHSLSMEIESEGFIAFLPEQPSPIEFSVRNHGNGVDRVKISIDGLPSGWSTTMLVDGEASDSTFEIDLAGYNGDVANITIVVVADASMSPGTEVWLTFTADSDIESLDSVPSIIQIGYVDVIRSFQDGNWQQQPENVRLGGLVNSSYTITNTGNVVDSNLQTKVSISPVIPGLELTVFVDGAQYPTNQFIPLDLGPGSNSVIDVVVTIDESVALGTEVTITRFVTGGDANSPQQSQEDLVFSISEMRTLELGNPPLNLVEMGPSSRSDITLEVKGRSTQPEQVSVSIVIPDGVEVKCTPQNGEGVPTVTIRESPDVDDVQQIECEIITGIDYDTGIIEFTMIASDGEEIGVFSTEIIRPEVEPGGFEIAGVDSMVIGGSAIIVILAVISLIIALRLRNRMSDEEDDFDSEDEEIPEQVLTFATTPMSIDSATNVVEEVVTQVQQWTDESGYTWRKMSDESIQWWNGTDWQDHA